MADKTIGALPKAAGVYDDSLIPAEQQGEAVSVSGAVLKKYARDAVAGTAQEAAQQAAAEATQSAAASAAAAAQSAAVAQEYGEDAVQRSVEAMEKITQADARSLEAAQRAAAAVTAAQNAEGDAGSALDAAENLRRQLSGLNDDLAAKVDGAYVENGYLYLTSGDEVAAGPLGPFSGTGGGGGGESASYLVTLKNLLESRVLTVSGGSVPLRVLYTSEDEDGMDDGAGVGALTVNGAAAATLSVPQGESTIDVGSYLVSGSNTVKLRVENSEGSSRTLSYTITVVSLTMTTPFDALAVYTGDVVFNYTVTGTGSKTVRFLMDGVELGTETVTSSGRSRSYAIPVQPDGAHVLTAYAEVSMDGTTVKSNTLTLGMLWVSAEMQAPAILTSFSREAATQGEIISIPYLVYDPMSETASVTLSVLEADGTVYSTRTLTAGRERQVWTIQDYPAGQVTFRLACLNAAVDLAVEVTEHTVSVEPVTDALALHFDPSGRSNLEDHPASWSDGEVAATFTGMGFTGADGWLTDEDGAAVLRILSGGEMSIPFKLFSGDARASGATVEVEMATHNVRDYDTVVLSCLSGGRGFQIASQYAELRSEQSRISMQFKEDEKVRVSFVVEPRNLNRLIYVYVDGILSGAIRYPENDNFAQSPAVGLTIGAESSGIDVYRIRLYTKGLTRREVLDNYIADRPLLSDRVDLAQRNDIFDLAEDIVISKLPPTLPYMVIQCPELPQYKGDKKTCRVEYINLADTARGFTAENVQIDVQGTSSAGYKKKNWKLKFRSGITCTASGETSDTYQLRPGSMPASAFCMKADVASSEGANNVELVRLYNDACPYKTPPQQADSRVRVGIDGLPCVIFWQNTETNEVRFWGKYNFNDEKSSEQVYGLTEGCESWEICNNTSDRVIFKSADFSGTAWQEDFEARYPEDNLDCTNLAAMCAWVVSTDRGAVSTEAEKAARLQKFKDEFEDHFVKAPMLFYYLFTEVFLMVDSRAKNFFPTTYDGTHWLPLPYDFDTAIGINNEGQLVFDYDLEDTDRVDGSNVFNGQESVLWCNLRDAFGDELREMYSSLRSGPLFSYAEAVRRYAQHQAVWPEAVWNEDAWEKYLEPLEHDGDSAYLTMLQGSKASQREWWLYNGFRYRDSKYQCGDASASFVTLRCYSVGDITVTPYSHIWPRVKYGSYTVTQRGKRNQPVTLPCPLDAMNDTEVYIYSADRLAAIGDLSGLQVGYANFSMAAKLQTLKLGDGAADYQNTRLTELYVGRNDLLSLLDVRKCVNLAMTVDLSGCTGLETVLAAGSGVTGFNLPVGGKLKKLELPGTVTNLTIRDQAQLEDLTLEGYSALTTIRIENTPGVPYEAMLLGAEALDRVRLIGAEWTASSAEALEETYNKLMASGGLDAAGMNTPRAVVSGQVTLEGEISAELLAGFAENFPDLLVAAGGMAKCTVRFRNWDGTVLYTAVVPYGSNLEDPVEAGLIDTPERASEGRTMYIFDGWDKPLDNIRGNLVVSARFTASTAWLVTFVNWDDTVLYQTTALTGMAVADPVATGKIPKPSRPGDEEGAYTFLGWDASLYNITADRTIKARYTVTQAFTVTFVDWDGTVLHKAYCAAGAAVADPLLAGFIQTPTRATDETAQKEYTFSGWDKSFTNITANTTVTASYTAKSYYTATFKNWDGTVLHQVKLYAGAKVVDPVADGAIQTPARTPEETYGYIYKGWDTTPTTSISSNVTYTAQYKTDREFTVTFVDWDNSVLYTAQVMDEDGAADPVTSGHIPTPARPMTDQYEYTYKGWDKAFSKITADTTVTATYTSTTRKYTVRFWNGSTLLGSVSVAYGITATYTGIQPEKPGVEDPENYIIDSWNPSNENIKTDTDCYATFIRANITDTWEEIFAAITDGSYSTKYVVGDMKPLDLGSEGLVFMQIAGFDLDDKADGSGKAPITWISKQLLKTSKRMNPSLSGSSGNYVEGTGAIGGWEKSEMRKYFQETVLPLIPENVRSHIVPVTKAHPAYNVTGNSFTQTTMDSIWIPSDSETVSTGKYGMLFTNIDDRRKKKLG